MNCTCPLGELKRQLPKATLTLNMNPAKQLHEVVSGDYSLLSSNLHHWIIIFVEDQNHPL